MPLLDWLFPGRTKTIPAEPLAAYPSADDAAQARAGGYGYGDPQSAYIEGKAGNVFGGFKEGKKVDPFVPKTPSGSLSQIWDKPRANLTGQSGINSGLLKDHQDAYTRAHLASNHLPIAALGLEGRNTTADMSGKATNIAGAYSADKDKAYFSGADPSSLLHESAHRGLALVKDRPELPERLRQRIGGSDEESIVRQLMQKYAGDPEQGPVDIQQKRIAAINPTPQNDIAALNDLVSKMMQERRPRGPR